MTFVCLHFIKLNVRMAHHWNLHIVDLFVITCEYYWSETQTLTKCMSSKSRTSCPPPKKQTGGAPQQRQRIASLETQWLYQCQNPIRIVNSHYGNFALTDYIQRPAPRSPIDEIFEFYIICMASFSLLNRCARTAAMAAMSKGNGKGKGKAPSKFMFNGEELVPVRKNFFHEHPNAI